MIFFTDFRVIFWQGCQCCKVAVLRSVFGEKICNEKKKFIYEFEMLSKKISDLPSFFGKSVKTAFYVSKGRFEGKLLDCLGNFFSRVSNLHFMGPKEQFEVFLSEKKISISCGL